MATLKLRLAITVLVVVAISGCGDDNGNHQSVTVDATTTSAPHQRADYAVYEDDTWRLVDAATDVPDPPVSLLDNGAWRAEYVRTVDEGDLLDADEVAVGGFRMQIDAAEEDLGRTGPVEFSDVDLSPWHGVIGSFQGDDESPLMVLLDLDATTVTALSYDLSEPELVEWVRSLDPSTEEEWLAHVGLS